MNTLQQVASLLDPVVALSLGGVVLWLAKQIGAQNVETIVRDAPEVLHAAEAVDKIPAVHRVVVDVEAAAKAEAERLDAATHGALDALASELAKALPAAVQSAVAAAKASLPATPAVTAPVPVPVADTAVEVPVASVTVEAPAPGAPVTTAAISTAAPA